MTEKKLIDITQAEKFKLVLKYKRINQATLSTFRKALTRSSL